MTYEYQNGDAADYCEWLEEQPPAVQETASRFRPWEFYKWQGRDIYVRVVGYDPSGQLITVAREDGCVFTIVPDQIDLYAIKVGELPKHRDYTAQLAKHTQQT